MRLSSFLLALLILSTSGCSWFKDAIDETSDWSANQLYSEAKEKLAEKNYEKAIEYFEILQARYPFGRYAQQAELEIAYAYYSTRNPTWPSRPPTASSKSIRVTPMLTMPGISRD